MSGCVRANTWGVCTDELTFADNLADNKPGVHLQTLRVSWRREVILTNPRVVCNAHLKDSKSPCQGYSNRQVRKLDNLPHEVRELLCRRTTTLHDMRQHLVSTHNRIWRHGPRATATPVRVARRPQCALRAGSRGALQLARSSSTATAASMRQRRSKTLSCCWQNHIAIVRRAPAAACLCLLPAQRRCRQRAQGASQCDPRHTPGSTSPPGAADRQYILRAL